MVSAVMSPYGAARRMSFSRTDEYVFVVMLGESAPQLLHLGAEWKISDDKRASTLLWRTLLRAGSNSRRADGQNQFYPIFLRNESDGPVFDSVGEPFFGSDRTVVDPPQGCVAVWPIRADGSEGTWQNGAETLKQLINDGHARVGRWRGPETTVNYLAAGERRKVEDGDFPIVGRRHDGSIVVDESNYSPKFLPGTQWRIGSHNSRQYGTGVVQALMPDRKFPFPKSLYAVEDALRFFVSDNASAIVLDFFSGSGTTAHAVMRLNKQDGGRRQSISITNNEVSAEEQLVLRGKGLRPSDSAWESFGICDYFTKPRVEAAISGRTPSGAEVQGDYRFTDEFPMADGFKENAEFFTLSYEAPGRVARHRDFAKIAPLLWIAAGSVGRRICEVPDGWDVANSYGVLVDLDQSGDFVDAMTMSDAVTHAFIVTDDERSYQAISDALPDRVESVRLYEAYLKNFEIQTVRSAQ